MQMFTDKQANPNLRSAKSKEEHGAGWEIAAWFPGQRQISASTDNTKQI